MSEVAQTPKYAPQAQVSNEVRATPNNRIHFTINLAPKRLFLKRSYDNEIRGLGVSIELGAFAATYSIF
jgi:hypothetical protein